MIQTCQDIGRTDLIECAELGVSELVTNAVLHGADPIQVRVRGTREHPRVEVRDASVEGPILPGPLGLDPDDDLLLTFGRGLSIVARSSDAWGAEIESDGKVVWFAPASQISEDEGVEGVIHGPDAPPEDELEDPVDVRILGVPLRHYVGFQTHFRELRREVRLLAVAHEADYPLAKTLSDLFSVLERQLRDGIGLSDMEGALAQNADVADLSVRMPREAATTLRRFVDLLDVADEFCRQERLLSLARSDDQREFQRWFLGEYVRQAAGAAPTAWVEPQTEPSALRVVR
ncbi:ATP-binding protein [Nocardioides nematodiphilus]|uniref:ATP-binding protein n=1 Tax=Nocardioides nematodiphilus TaxID=2849669 RepID=UPI001CDA35EC|nr:ATP-binding protein [Nocardioides nematodiphilus]MCA1983412.1 ATP-binding protein [Nocardioides nematodiphilus]